MAALIIEALELLEGRNFDRALQLFDRTLAAEPVRTLELDSRQARNGLTCRCNLIGVADCTVFFFTILRSDRSSLRLFDVLEYLGARVSQLPLEVVYERLPVH